MAKNGESNLQGIQKAAILLMRSGRKNQLRFLNISRKTRLKS